MDEQEFADSEVATAFGDYLESSHGILELTGMISRTFDAISKNVDLDSIRDPFGAFADQIADVIQRNKNEGYPVLHPLIVTASWGALLRL